ncbi:hypothetical protein P3517_01775 [Vibrio parahaemolyticus]|uniref:hypothetical protein n=1 Tax=Vibrio parahaemolyticus TaxID=670 RepID=UPI00387AC3DD|nr:hypothetical protein [Vibrio parahaemolyticus]HCG5904652.1 hypothetical protein [Vibrio parahaemolyticus]
MSRTIQALKLITEELEDQGKRIDKLERKVRNLEIRDKVRVQRRKQVDVAREYNLSPSSISEISKHTH